MLPPEIQYVLPIQDDFFLERPGVNKSALEDAIRILDTYPEIQSLRLMPCPGGNTRETLPGTKWVILNESQGDMIFCYQATLWRREIYEKFMDKMVCLAKEACPEGDSIALSRYAVNMNPAELSQGQIIMKQLTGDSGIHLCWMRVGAWANAVYQCPWPYRPTAVVKGVFQPWAKELLQREGLRIPDV